MLYSCTVTIGAHLLGWFVITSLLSTTGTLGAAPSSISSTCCICSRDCCGEKIMLCLDEAALLRALCPCGRREKCTIRRTKSDTAPASSRDNATYWQTLYVWQDGPPEAFHLTREEYVKRLAAVSAFADCASPRKPHHCEALLGDLVGRQQCEQVRALLQILEVKHLPSMPKFPIVRLSDEELRDINGFIISSALEIRPRSMNPDRVAYTHVLSGERVKVHIIYDKSPADALRRLIESAWMISSAPLFQILPTCRMYEGPGNFCWLGWTPTNQDRTRYCPSTADVLFIRNGVAVLLQSQDASRHQSVTALAKELDELIVDSYRQQKESTQPLGDQ